MQGYVTANVTNCFHSGHVLFTFLMAVTKHWALDNFRDQSSLPAHSLKGQSHQSGEVSWWKQLAAAAANSGLDDQEASRVGLEAGLGHNL